jgi:hypothetical protein
VPEQRQRVLCGVTGSAWRSEVREQILRHRARADDLIVDVSPSYILQQGLPYARSRLAIVLDASPADVPERYQDYERSRRLMSVLADAVDRGGVVIAPAKEWEIQDYARDEGCRVAIFATDGDVTARDKRLARTVACVTDGRIMLERFGECTDAGPRSTPSCRRAAGGRRARRLHAARARPHDDGAEPPAGSAAPMAERGNGTHTPSRARAPRRRAAAAAPRVPRARTDATGRSCSSAARARAEGSALGTFLDLRARA